MVDDLASDVKCDVGVDVPSASVAAAFRTVIEQHQAGDSRHYGRLLDSIDAMSKSSAACNSVPKLIVQCEQVIDAITDGSCKRLLVHISLIPWTHLPIDVVEQHAQLCTKLALSCPQMMRKFVESFVGRFIIDDMAGCVDAVRQSETDNIVHDALEKLLHSGEHGADLSKVVARLYPHSAGSCSRFRHYTLNILRLSIYTPVTAKTALLSIVIDRLSTLDASTKVGHETRAQIIDALFEMDVADGVAGDETHTRAGFACTCLHGADQTLTLDVCLLDLCRFLQAYVERTLPGGEHLLTWLLPAFDEHVLGSTQLGRVPAIYLALCAHDVTVCTAFLEHLWQAVLVNDVLHISASEQCDDPPVPRFVRTCTHAATHAPSSTTRRRRSTRHSTLRQSQSAVCHMTSLLSYCKYNTRADLCHRWLYEWMRWCTAYRADDAGRMHIPAASLEHGLYYSIVYAIVNLIVHRIDDFDVRQIRAMHVSTLISCPLDPLAHCTAPLARAFVRLCKYRRLSRKTALMQTYLREQARHGDTHNVDSNSSGASLRLSAVPFTPFSPYTPATLSRSGRILRPLHRDAIVFDDDDQISDDEQLPPPPIHNVQSIASIIDANDDGMHASEPDDELPPLFTYEQRSLTAVFDDYSFVMAGSFERGMSPTFV